MFHACIFDLDGTLVDTLPTVHYYSNCSLLHFGFSPISIQQCQGLCRLGIAEFYPRLLQLGGCPAEKIGPLLEPIRQYDLEGYLRDTRYLTRPYAGVEDMLRRLKEQRVVVAVLTNKPAPLAESLLSELYPGLIGRVAGQTPDSISKPDPRSLTNLIAQLGLTREQCLYVGDTDVDMRTAKGAGVAACAVTWGYQTPEELSAFAPEYTADSPNEICSILKLS